eukprot:COSAG05_NODE_1486_length_4730_cov_147.028288_6_plen_52_part_01
MPQQLQLYTRDPYIDLELATIVELSEKGKHLTRNFWPARGICIEGSETVYVF